MRRIYILFLVSILFSAPAMATNFIDGFEDIPLINGFNQIKSQNFSFGNEESGYTEATIISYQKKNFNEVKNFYKQSLIELGWKLKNDTPDTILFDRENNLLEISLIKKRPLKVLISLKSKN